MQNAVQNSEEDINMVGPQLLHEEIIKALEAMKLGKTEGADGIPIKMIKGLGKKATEENIENKRSGVQWPSYNQLSLLIRQNNVYSFNTENRSKGWGN